MESQFEDAEEEICSDLLVFAKKSDEQDSKTKRARSAEEQLDDSEAPEDTDRRSHNKKVAVVPCKIPAGIDRLSKWAARLFDPDRPKGLIQPPQTIPLNDEFLQAFGQREKATDAARGISLEINHAIDDDDEEDTERKPTDMSSTEQTKKKSNLSKRKVKITNIKFTTTTSTLEAACRNFGPVEYTNLIMDQERGGAINAGRAYVTFEEAESAQACVDNLKSVDQRPVTVTMATMTTSSSSSRNAAFNTRYWQADKKDLTTKCFRCGQVGHMAADCTNEAAVKPCPLCAGTDHEIRNCPVKAVCFNCGIPGHVSRECRQPRGLPPRRICTICYRTDHHKTQCRSNNRVNVPPSVQAAVCLSCGRSGHYLCKDLKWFFGLQGVTCCNCGMPGHIGAQCPRPILDVCCRNDTTTRQEIERASTVSLVEEAIVQANSSQQHLPGKKNVRPNNERGRRMDTSLDSRRNDNQRRFKSLPPPRSGWQGNNNNNNNNNSNDQGGSNRRNQQSSSHNNRKSRWASRSDRGR